MSEPIPGVSWDKRAGKWRARDKRNGQDIHLGNYHTVQEANAARQAYDDYTREHAEAIEAERTMQDQRVRDLLADLSAMPTGPDPDEMEGALCAQSDPDAWYPEKGSGSGWAHIRAICEQCPVIEKCRDYALKNDEPHGIWGGMTPADRRKWWRDREEEEEAAS